MAEPLPECTECGTPMRRVMWADQDGVCTPCQTAARLQVALQPWYDR
jgi:hypothetical protein